MKNKHHNLYDASLFKEQMKRSNYSVFPLKLTYWSNESKSKVRSCVIPYNSSRLLSTSCRVGQLTRRHYAGFGVRYKTATSRGNLFCGLAMSFPKFMLIILILKSNLGGLSSLSSFNFIIHY